MKALILLLGVVLAGCSGAGDGGSEDTPTMCCQFDGAFVPNAECESVFNADDPRNKEINPRTGDYYFRGAAHYAYADCGGGGGGKVPDAGGEDECRCVFEGVASPQDVPMRECDAVYDDSDPLNKEVNPRTGDYYFRGRDVYKFEDC